MVPMRYHQLLLLVMLMMNPGMLPTSPLWCRPTVTTSRGHRSGGDIANSLNIDLVGADTTDMSSHQPAQTTDRPRVPDIGPGTILVNWAGQIRIIRSRTSDGTGWNCADGAAIDDARASDPEQWTAYTPEQLAADLSAARDLREISGHRALGGGLATWDACSGRPCILPKLARVANRREHPLWSHGERDDD